MKSKVNLAASTYVRGGISVKARDRWVDNIPDESERTVVKLMEWDEEVLSLTATAAGRMYTNVNNALNKVNKEGKSRGWTSHICAMKKKIGAQFDLIREFRDDLREAQAKAKENSQKPKDKGKWVYEDEAPADQPVEEPVEATVEDKVEETKTDYSILHDASLREVLDLSLAGLRGTDRSKELEDALEQVEALTAVAKVATNTIEDLKAENESLRGDLERAGNRAENDKRTISNLKAENKDIKNKHRVLEKKVNKWKSAFSELGS